MYKCEFPGCLSLSDNSDDFHKHHIVPREFNGTDKSLNLIRVCPTCHNKIYVPGTKHKGTKHHESKIRDESIIIKKVVLTNAGYAIEYTRVKDSYEGMHLLDNWRNTDIDKLFLQKG